jgi:hypothetical protein
MKREKLFSRVVPISANTTEKRPVSNSASSPIVLTKVAPPDLTTTDVERIYGLTSVDMAVHAKCLTRIATSAPKYPGKGVLLLSYR